MFSSGGYFIYRPFAGMGCSIVVAVVLVVAVADGIEAVVVADMEAVAEIHHIGDAFTGDSLY